MVSVLFISFVICLAIGIPVAFSLGVASCIYFIGAGMPINMFAQKFFAGMDSFTLLCIPGFTLAGNLMNQGGISDKLLDFAETCVGHLRGGLAYANVLASMVFAGISGTALADTVALGGIEIPMMVNQGYDVPFSVAVTAASSCMGPIIPPSVPMIIAATMTGLSVSRMFMAGIVPGILMGGGMCFVCWYESKKHNYPKRDRRASMQEIIKSGREAFWAILMTFIILFGIMGGVMTPTEASIVCVAYGTIVSFFIYKKLNLKSFYACLKQTLSSAAAIMGLVAFANVFAYILTAERIPQMVATAILSVTDNRFAVIILINIVLLFVGMFMESLAAILITFPVLLPVATAVGMDPVHFALMAILNLMLGLTTPPVGMCVCTAAQIGKVSAFKAFKATVPFFIASLVVLALVSFVPAVTLFIPGILD